ncbi:hypothetical protein, partial [Rhodovulum sp.]|uniref:hypothetical protein n=1 Tax=Rhodovulum sp. TaxID=34009 RepID=UPI00257D1123
RARRDAVPLFVSFSHGSPSGQRLRVLYGLNRVDGQPHAADPDMVAGRPGQGRNVAIAAETP